MEEITPQRYIELADRHKERLELDEAISFYQKACRLDSENAGLYAKLGDSYLLRAELREDRLNDRFTRLSLENFRKAAELNPKNEGYLYKVFILARKLCSLDEVTIEYKKKLESEKDPEIRKVYENCISKIPVLMLFDKGEDPRKKYVYRPHMLLTIAFDLGMLPGGLVFILIGNNSKKWAWLLPEGVGLLIFYLFYRLFLMYVRRK